MINQSLSFPDDADEIPVAAMDNLAAEAVMMHDPTFGDYAYGGDYEGINIILNFFILYNHSF